MYCIIVKDMWPKVLKTFFWSWWDNFSKNILVSAISFIFNFPLLAFTLGLFVFMRVPTEIPPTSSELTLFWIVISSLFGMSMFFPTQLSLLGMSKRFAMEENKRFFPELWEEIKTHFLRGILASIVVGMFYALGVFAIGFYSIFFGLPSIIGIILSVITFWYLIVFSFFFIILSLYFVFFPKDSIKTAIQRSWVIMMDNIMTIFMTVLMIIPIFLICFISAIGMFLFYQGVVNALLVAMFIEILRKYKVIENVEDTRTIKDIFKPF